MRPDDPPPPPEADAERARFEDTVEQEMLVWALERLALCHGTSFSPSQLRLTVQEAQRQHPGPAETQWPARLQAAAHAADLELAEAQQPLADVMTLVSRGGLVILRANDARAPHLVAITERAGRRVRVLSSLPADQAHPDDARWLDFGGLYRLLGLPGPHAPVTAVFAEPRTPLQGLNRADEQPPGHTTPPLSRLRALMAMERTDLWVVLAYAVAVGVVSLATPIAVQALVNTIAFGSLFQPLIVLSILLLGCLGFVALLRSLQFYIVEMIQRRVFVRAAADFAFRLPRVRVDGFGGHYGPELVNRFLDVVTVQKSTAQLLLDGLAVALQAGTGLFLLAFYHPLLLALAGVLIAALVFNIFVLGRGGIRTAIKESKTKYAMAAWLEELVRRPVTFKTSSGRRLAVTRADALAKEYILARRKHFGVVLRQMVGGLATQAIASTLLLGLGGWLVMERQLTLGQLVASELVLTAVVAGFNKLGKNVDAFYKLIAALDKLGMIIDLPLEPDAIDLLPPGQGPATLTLRQVSYTYPGGRPALHDLSLHIGPGEHVALTGTSGSGKRTLLELAFGLRSPTRGTVLIDDIDVPSLRLDSLRRDVLYLDGVEIFAGTVTDNVTLGRADVSAAVVREALASVDLLDDVMALPEGLQTQLIGTGAPLSGSQAQRLVLARALALRPRLLLARETLDHLPPELRARVVDAVLGPGAPWTALVITRDDAVASACVRAIELDDGRARPSPGRPAP